MKRRDWMKTAAAALAAVGLGRLAAGGSEAEKKFAADFGSDWDTAKAYTLEVAEAMPAEKYGFKPTAEMRTFGELLAHIGGSLYMFSAGIRGEQPPAAGKPPEEKSREAVVAYLKGAFDYAAETVAGLDDARAAESVSLFGGRLSLPRSKVCHFMRDHVTHHRAYGLPYLRLNGVEPPRYRFAGTRPSPV